MVTTGWRALAAASGLFAASAALAAPFAMITELKGEAWAVEQGKPRKLSLLGYLDHPGEIRIDSAGKLAITYFRSGVQYSFAGPARVALDNAAPKMLHGEAPQFRKVTPEKAIGGGLTPDQWRRLQEATVVMRAVKSSFAVVSPDKTAVLEREPRFEWTSAPGAKGYRLVVYSAQNEILHEATTEQNALTPGPALRLQPGQRYRWKIDALGVLKPVSASGSFTVASDTVREELLFLKASAGNDAAARVFYATALEARGHGHDARAEWKALARDYPEELEFRQRAR
jgi:hypothetical protein